MSIKGRPSKAGGASNKAAPGEREDCLLFACNAHDQHETGSVLIAHCTKMDDAGDAARHDALLHADRQCQQNINDQPEDWPVMLYLLKFFCVCS